MAKLNWDKTRITPRDCVPWDSQDVKLNSRRGKGKRGKRTEVPPPGKFGKASKGKLLAGEELERRKAELIREGG